jgi:hypothetical protein
VTATSKEPERLSTLYNRHHREAFLNLISTRHLRQGDDRDDRRHSRQHKINSDSNNQHNNQDWDNHNRHDQEDSQDREGQHHSHHSNPDNPAQEDKICLWPLSNRHHSPPRKEDQHSLGFATRRGS